MTSRDQRGALVTGGGGGIGSCICASLARAGYDVVVQYHSDRAGAERAAESVRSAGRVAAVLQADCGDPEDVASLFADAADALDGIDCLVANHAVVDHGLTVELTLERWERTISVNLTGPFLLIKACLPGMMERGWGRIVAITGSLAHTGGEGFSHLSASKAGLELLVKSVAYEAGGMGVTANLVSPGPTNTRLLDGVPEEFMEKRFAELPLGRFAEPEDVAAAVAFLASEEARSITGQTVRVNCGDVMIA